MSVRELFDEGRQTGRESDTRRYPVDTVSYSRCLVRREGVVFADKLEDKHGRRSAR